MCDQDEAVGDHIELTEEQIEEARNWIADATLEAFPSLRELGREGLLFVLDGGLTVDPEDA